ncbi:hypothetical protein G6F46_011452 [Rhizopus delemar]|nr:hypothetical protein G6F46_011452 [Rhizopus delemar]
MIQRLTQELAAARSEIEQLRTTAIQLQNQLKHERLIRNQPTPPVITNTQSSFDIPEPTPTASPWRNPNQVRRLKENLMQQRQQRRQQRQEATARILQSPFENQGFKYIYLPTKARVPIGQLRSRLRKLDINNNRILDTHYPDRNVVALLVHNDYADELRSHLQRFKIFYAEGWISKQNLQENLPSSRRNSESESDPLCFEYKNQDPPSDEACMNDALSL